MQDVDTRTEQRRRGIVASLQYSSEYGHRGYIKPDHSNSDVDLIPINSQSLRDSTGQVKAGDSVLFAKAKTSRGDIATRVSVLVGEGMGTVTILNERGYGILELEDGRTALFHFTDLDDPFKPPPIGAWVTAWLFERWSKNSATGLYEVNLGACRLQPSQELRTPGVAGRVDSNLHKQAKGLLARALLAREIGQWVKAEQIYEQGLISCPATVVFLSYAAMEKNMRHNPKKALGILERGTELYPENPKLHEDAGLLAASLMQFPRAVELLRQALELSRKPGQAGEKGILLALARTCYKIGGISALKDSIRYYEDAEKVFPDHRLPFESDVRDLHLARFRVQHYRGDLTVQFFEDAGFQIVHAELHKIATLCGDLVVRAPSAEFTESYGLGELLPVRVMFQTNVGYPELNDMDKHLKNWRESQTADTEVAILVVASLTDETQRILYSRSANERDRLPALVPISQENMERAADKAAALRAALDKWLFRRDLFAENMPVLGAQFFGRMNQIAEIQDAVSTSQSVGIFGLRKVGKTSTLHEIRRRCEESGDIVLYMDLLALPEGVEDTRWLYWELGRQLRDKSQFLIDAKVMDENRPWRLGGAFIDFFDIPKEFPVSVAFDADLKKVLTSVRDAPITTRPKVVLFLDEVERLMPLDAESPGIKGFADLLSYFRGVSQQTNAFTMIVTAANPAIAEIAHFGQRDNPVFNYFKLVYLDFFDKDECKKMITRLGRGMGMTFEDDACAGIHLLTGGHPFITRQLCSFLAKKYTDRPMRLTGAIIKASVDEYLGLQADKDFYEIFQRLSRDYPQERDMCVELAQVDDPLPLNNLTKGRSASRPMLRHLIGYQLVRIDDNSRVALSMELMKLWLRKTHANNDSAVKV